MSFHGSTSAESKTNAPTRKKVTTRTLEIKKRKSIPITMLTAYDYAAAKQADDAGIDMILVGDSLAQVVLGHPDTVSVTVDEMLHHCKAVARGSTYSLTVGDMPFMSYRISREETVRNAGRFMKEGRMQAVKMEGGQESAEMAYAVSQAGIPVVGHVGFTPQTVSKLGGYRIQGRTANAAIRLYEDALALQQAGCIAIVLEMVPADVAAAISERLAVPTIGIGAGAGCDGQVLVYHDILGLIEGARQARFVRQYATLAPQIREAFSQYIEDVKARAYPAEQHTYPIKDEAYQEFLHRLEELHP